MKSHRSCSSPVYSHGSSGVRSMRLLCVIFAVVTLAAGWDLCAFGQETGTGGPPSPDSSTTRPRLERVDVPRPVRRAPTTGTPVAQGEGYDDAGPSDQPSSQTQGTSRGPGLGGGTGTGSVVPFSSLVSAKSGISVGAAALPSPVQVLNREDIARLNVRDPTDLFKKVAAMNAFSYNQGDVGTPVIMRGFFGAHGTNTAVFIDGVPQNFPSMTETHGACDFAWLTPEIIERIEIIKGPFSALYGDFAMAGAVNIITKNYQESPSIAASGGSYGSVRGYGVLSSQGWCPTPFLAHEYYQTDGYRDNTQYSRWSPFNKVSMPLRGGILSLQANYYQSTYRAPGYLVIDDVRKGLVNRTHAVNLSDGGNQKRSAFILNYAPAVGETGLYATAYVAKYKPNRWATYPPDLVNQWTALDDRIYWGGRIYYNLAYCNVASCIAGLETRQDNGSAFTGTSVNRNLISTSYDYDLRLSNWAWFVQGQVKIAETFKVVSGVRGDSFDLRVGNLTRPLRSGSGFPSIVSPKVGVVLTPKTGINVYANKGFGFRSPAANELSPAGATAQANFNLDVAKVDSWDVGFNAGLFDNLYLAGAYYQTFMEREIRTINGRPLNVGDTERKGCEVEARFYASPDIAVFVSYGWVDAKVKNPVNAGQVFVPAIPADMIKGGVEITKQFCGGRKVSADAYYQYFSGTPNYVGTSIVPLYGPDWDAYNFRLAYEERGWSGFLSAKYQPRELSSDYVSTQGNQLTFDPKPVWDLSGGVRYAF